MDHDMLSETFSRGDASIPSFHLARRLSTILAIFQPSLLAGLSWLRALNPYQPI